MRMRAITVCKTKQNNWLNDININVYINMSTDGQGIASSWQHNNYTYIIERLQLEILSWQAPQTAIWRINFFFFFFFIFILTKQNDNYFNDLNDKVKFDSKIAHKILSMLHRCSLTFFLSFFLFLFALSLYIYFFSLSLSRYAHSRISHLLACFSSHLIHLFLSFVFCSLSPHLARDEYYYFFLFILKCRSL